MVEWLTRHLVRLAVTILGIVTLTFFLVHSIPGDPAQYMLGDYATKEALEALRIKLGLNLPLYQQYLTYLGRALTGDFGESVVSGRPALGEILRSLPASAVLACSGLFVAILVGIPLGIVTAVRHGSALDVLVMIVALLGISFPVFWLGLAGILLFSRELGWLPALGATSSPSLLVQIHHLILPSVVLGLSVAAYITRLTRSAMLEILSQDYIMVARALGVPERRIVWRLAMKNAAIPIISIVGVTFAWAIGNAILVEVVFSRSGTGTLIMKAVLARDYQLVMAGVFVLSVMVVLINMVLDIAYAIVDPRLRT